MSVARNGNILLVEPSSLSGGIIVSTARQLKLPVVNLVSSVRSARQRLEHEDFSGVILSLEEDREALMLLNDLRGAKFSAPNAHIPIVVLTSHINESLVLQMKVFDVRRVLLKPFKVRDVITSIQILQEAS